MNDMEMLTRARGLEDDPRTGARVQRVGWAPTQLGNSVDRKDIDRLCVEASLEPVVIYPSYRTYRLTDLGRKLTAPEAEHRPIPAASVLKALDVIVGYEDLKGPIAMAVETRKRVNFLFVGPPASAKSLFLDGVRAAVPDAYMAFGTRTSAAGLSEALFTYRPSVLLLDEANLMPVDVYGLLLGLMERGEVLETKAKQSRGIILNTTVLAACNTSEKMPQAFLSRCMRFVFPPYTRQEFLDVCVGVLPVQYGCPEELAGYIGARVWDYGLGDVRTARALWDLLPEPTEAAADKMVRILLKYGGPGVMQRGRLRQPAPQPRMGL
ncbi:MAG: hypothetical protein Q8P59_09995 [Dehalococcoidia bacterium]|nr:hypothetical protein [Dehalococcoidia bacterium]